MPRDSRVQRAAPVLVQIIAAGSGFLVSLVNRTVLDAETWATTAYL